MLTSKRNIGIFAHVDAGKTTLTEQILYHTGAIRKAGRVDEGTAHTDSLAIERQRGISVRTGTACVRHGETEIRIIDTPGHVDFSSEVETALLAVDGAVLVVSAVEGVQAQTAVICRVLSALEIPTIAFINKTDRAGADISRVLVELENISPRLILLEQNDDDLVDQLSALDDELLEEAVEGRVARESMQAALRRTCSARTAIPVVSGAALKGIGVQSVLDAIVNYLPPPADVGILSVAAYNVRRDGEERQVRVRVFGGELRLGLADEGFGRVKRLRAQTPGGEETVTALRPGDIGVAVGLEGLRAGMWIGQRCRGQPEMAAPVLRAQVVPQDENELPALLTALNAMHDENGGLSPAFEPRDRQVHIRVMGEIHQQVVEQTLLDAHGIRARLMPPEVLYRETPIQTGCGKLDMFFSPWYARAAFEVAPLPRGSGVRFITKVNTDQIYLKYLRDIEETVYEALSEGLHGWPVTDLSVTLTDAQCISITRPGSRFGPVVPLGLFAALKDAGTELLEPVLRFDAQVDEAASSALLYELSLVRAQCEPVEYSGGTALVSGLVPVETSRSFSARFNELSRGRGTFRTRLDGFYPAPPGCGRDIPRTTPDPCVPTLYMDYITGRRAT